MQLGPVALPGRYAPDDEIEIILDDPLRPLVSTVEVLSVAPYFAGLLSGSFAPLPKNAAERYTLRLPDFGRGPFKAVLNYMRTGVGPHPLEMRADQRAEYLRQTDYLGLDASYNVVVTQPERIVCAEGAVAMAVGPEGSFYATRTREVWRAPADEAQGPVRVLCLQDACDDICTMTLSQGQLFVGATWFNQRVSAGGTHRSWAQNFYAFDLAAPEGPPVHQRCEVPWARRQDLGLTATKDGVEVRCGEQLCSWSPPAAMVPTHRSVQAPGCFVAGERYTARSLRNMVTIRDTATGVSLSRIEENEAFVTALAMQGGTLFVGCGDGTVRQFDAATGQRARIVQVGGTPLQIAWNSDFLWTLDNAGAIKVWDPER